MLTRLRLRNFKSWADTGDVALRPVTAFFGSNGSGKSSLLQAILLLKQTTESTDWGLALNFGNERWPLDLGSFVSVVHGRNPARELEVAIDWDRNRVFEIRDGAREDRLVCGSRQLAFRTTVAQSGEKGQPWPVVKEMAYRVGEAEFGMRQRAAPETEYELMGSVPADADFQFVASDDRKRSLPAPGPSHRFPDHVRAYYRNAGFLADLTLALEQRLKGVAYLGPLRAPPERRHVWAGAGPPDVGQAGEAVVDAIAAARERGDMISLGHGKRKLGLEQYVAKQLKELGLVHDFRVAPVSDDWRMYEVRVKRTSRSAEVLLPDAGFGVAQILPVVVLCSYVPEGSTVLLEHPEIHLHPSAQAGLADVMIDAWKNRKVQVVVESHSEHLLRRLQRRIAEDEIAADEVGLYFCDMVASRSTIKRLDLDPFGNVANWPANFFGDEFGEIAAAARAAIGRRRESAQ